MIEFNLLALAIRHSRVQKVQRIANWVRTYNITRKRKLLQHTYLKSKEQFFNWNMLIKKYEEEAMNRKYLHKNQSKSKNILLYYPRIIIEKL